MLGVWELIYSVTWPNLQLLWALFIIYFILDLDFLFVECKADAHPHLCSQTSTSDNLIRSFIRWNIFIWEPHLIDFFQVVFLHLKDLSLSLRNPWWKIIAWDKPIFPFLLREIQKYHIGKSTTLVGIFIKDILGVYPIGKSITLIGISTKDILSDCGNYHQ